MTTAAAKVRTGFFEGANRVALIIVPMGFLVTAAFYGRVVTIIKPLAIEVSDVYGYVFNLYAIEVGALLAIFALFACRPTPFLERMKNTNTFSAIVSNTNITLLMAVATLAATFVLGILKMAPRDTLEIHSVLFLGWCCLTVAATIVAVRTIRLMMTALV